MPYTATNDLNTLDATKPVGSLEPVSILDDALRETRRTFKTVFTSKHTSVGDHKTGVIGTTHLADGAVTAIKITDATITAAKMAAGVLAGGNLTALSVDTAQINDLAVTTGKLAASAVTGAKIADTTITPAKLGTSGGAGRVLVGQTDGTWLSVALSGGATISAAGLITLAASLNVGVWGDVNPQNAAAQTLVTGWNTRRLNSEIYDPTSLASVSSNTLTNVPIGSYVCIAAVSAVAAGGVAVGINALRLYDVTGSATKVSGTSSNMVGTTEQGHAFMFGQFSLAAISTLRLDHYVTGNNTLGGTPLNQAGSSEVYATLILIQTA